MYASSRQNLGLAYFCLSMSCAQLKLDSVIEASLIAIDGEGAPVLVLKVIIGAGTSDLSGHMPSFF